jgi:hypothetical protein
VWLVYAIEDYGFTQQAPHACGLKQFPVQKNSEQKHSDMRFAARKIRRCTVKTLDTLVDKALSRRSFLAAAGAVAATTAMAGCSDDGTVTTSTGQYSDADVLNYALNLEYLEAEFYLRAATGSGLAAADTTPGSASTYQTVGSVIPGSAGAVPGLSSAQQALLNEIAYEEQEHVRFLRSALGTAAVPRPALDLSFFGPLAYTAGFTPTAAGAGSFNPFSSFDNFLVGAYVFEDVGVTAYSGAAPMISAAGVTAGYLTAAGGILAVEAYHAAFIRTSLTARAIAAGTASAYPYLGYANQIAALRATLTVGNSAAPSSTGSVETLLTLPATISSPSAIVPCSPTTGVGFLRTVNQVLHIVYGSGTVGAKGGGFFPNGVNSIFATTTA